MEHDDLRRPRRATEEQVVGAQVAVHQRYGAFGDAVLEPVQMAGDALAKAHRVAADAQFVGRGERRPVLREAILEEMVVQRQPLEPREIVVAPQGERKKAKRKKIKGTNPTPFGLRRSRCSRDRLEACPERGRRARYASFYSDRSGNRVAGGGDTRNGARALGAPDD